MGTGTRDERESESERASYEVSWTSIGEESRREGVGPISIFYGCREIDKREI